MKIVETIASRLEARGVKVTRAVVPRISARRCDLGRLRAYLDEKPDLVLHQTWVEPVVREIASRVPHISFSGSIKWLRTPRCLGCIDETRDSAYAEFVNRVKNAGVRLVAVADFQRYDHAIYGMLKRAGIAMDRWLFPPERPNNVALIRQAAFDGMRRLVSTPDFNFPQVIYFADDHVAQGALMAFSEMGVKVPRDVSVVSFCNTGDMPTSPVELARIETDPAAVGERAADAALAYLKAQAGCVAYGRLGLHEDGARDVRQATGHPQAGLAGAAHCRAGRRPRQGRLGVDSAETAFALQRQLREARVVQQKRDSHCARRGMALS